MATYYVKNNIIYVDGYIDKKRYRISTKKEANKLNLKWISKHCDEVLLKLVVKEKPKISENFVEYAYKSLENNSYSRKISTNKEYKQILDKYIIPYFKNFSLSDFKVSYLREWQNKLLQSGLSPKRVKNIRIVLSTIFKDALADELIEKDYLKLVKMPKQEPTQIECYNFDEVKLILDHSKDWFKDFLTVAFFSGMRTGEIMALKWSDIDFVNREITISRAIRQGIISSTKTNEIRTIDMLDIVFDTLKNKASNKEILSEYIFPTKKGTPYSDSSTISKNYWKPIVKNLDIPYHPLYNSRHFFASFMLQNNEDIAWVSKMLGHKDISTTLKYYAKYIRKKDIKRAEFLSKII